MPFRRFQRRFHIGGESLQQQTKERVLKGIGVEDATPTKVTRGEGSPSRDFNLVRATPDDEGRLSVRCLMPIRLETKTLVTL